MSLDHQWYGTRISLIGFSRCSAHTQNIHTQNIHTNKRTNTPPPHTHTHKHTFDELDNLFFQPS